MKKLAMLLTAAMCVAAAPAFAEHHMHKDMEMHMKAMDANNDGMISRDEFMRFHEMRWNELKKNSSGMVDMKEMHAMHKKMWSDKKDKDKDKTK